jgi:hypothetical protein
MARIRLPNGLNLLLFSLSEDLFLDPSPRGNGASFLVIFTPNDKFSVDRDSRQIQLFEVTKIPFLIPTIIFQPTLYFGRLFRGKRDTKLLTDHLYKNGTKELNVDVISVLSAPLQSGKVIPPIGNAQKH